MFYNLEEYYTHKLQDFDKRVGAGDELADFEHQCVMLYARNLKNLQTAKAMAEAESAGMRGGMSFADGRGIRGNSYGYPAGMSWDDGSGNMGNMRGGNMGNMSMASGRGYSRADRMDAVVDSVSSAMSELPPDMQQDAQRFLTRMQQARSRM